MAFLLRNSILVALLVSVLLLGDPCSSSSVQSNGRQKRDLGVTCSDDPTCESAVPNSVCDVVNTKCVCNAGYVENAGSSACEGITCAVPASAVDNAVITCGCSDPAVFGDPCTYTCESGYTDSGSGTVICGDNDSDGTGDFVTTSLCTAITCAVPASAVDNAVITCGGGSTANFGDSCTYTCENGFTGSGTVICGDNDSDGTGDFVTTSLCTAITCAVPASAVDNAVITCGGGSTANFGDSCTYTCENGFTGSGTVICGDNDSDGTGDFVTTSLCTPDSSGTAKTCALITTSGDASVDCTGLTDPAADQETCSYTCNSGYFGSGTITCDGSSGLFDTPSCQAITCPALSTPSNGNAPSCTDGVNYNSVCTFTCTDGFSITGTATSTCTGDGSSATGSFGSTPTCEDGCAIAPCTIPNSVCTGSDADVFSCRCEDGYTGDPTNSCTAIQLGTDCSGDTTLCDFLTNAICDTSDTNTCICDDGFVEDAGTCVDGCTGTCDVNAACTGTEPNFTCQCNVGYSGDGATCEEIDECTTDTDICGTGGTCSNINGSYNCTCDDGYTGGGEATPCTGGAIGMNNSSFSVFLPAFLMILSAIFLR